MEAALTGTLSNTPLDLQITICTFLHPSDILELRKTCKALELATRQRIVWVAALHRVCIDNALFLPSFPIPDMSDLELERAAMAPRRWTELCGSGMFLGRRVSKMLHPRTRIIKDDKVKSLFIIPGGRFLVTAGNSLSVWDLGYVPTVECKLVASAGLGDDFEFCVAQATPDGKGLVILASYSSGHLSIFEIYPQSEIPLLTQIAHLDWFREEELPAYLLPDIVICHLLGPDMIVFRIVDYRTNYSTCFRPDVDIVKELGSGKFKIVVTKTTIIIIYRRGLLIWGIPSLSPQSSDFLDNNSTPILPLLFKIPFPDSIGNPEKILGWIIVSSWYFGSRESLYFDMVYTDSIQRFKIIIKPDLSDASLHAISDIYITADSIRDSMSFIRLCGGFKICEDTRVYFWYTYNNNQYNMCHWGLCGRSTFNPFTSNVRRWNFGRIHPSTSAPFANDVTRWDGHINSLCPTSCRSVYSTDDCKGIVVVDLF